MVLRWPIRVKLSVALCLVVGITAVLLGGAFFGLYSYRGSIRTFEAQRIELNLAAQLWGSLNELDPPDSRAPIPVVQSDLDSKLGQVASAVEKYRFKLKENTEQNLRLRPGKPPELEIIWKMESHLGELNKLLRRDPVEIGASHDPGRSDRWKRSVAAEIKQVKKLAITLSRTIYDDMGGVIKDARGDYQTSFVMVWTSSFAVILMLVGLVWLLNRWILYPVRILYRGVRRVARGSFDHRIRLDTRDEMHELAEAFNEMTVSLSETYRDLEHKVNERSRQLVRSERLASVGFLAAGVAHEINNPLASIAFCSEALESRLNGVLAAMPEDGEVVQNYLRMIQTEAFRCKRITEQLLDFSRVGEVQRQDTDLTGVIRGVIEMIQHMGKYRDKTILFTPAVPVRAWANAQELKQVVLNLVVNALESMDPGGRVQIDLAVREGMAVLTFADTGCGMSPEVLENIFEPFFTRRRGGKGTGLGLSITHRIVTQHGGDILATSPGEGRGSTFTVRLPVPSPEPSPIGTGDRGPAVRRIDGPESSPAGSHRARLSLKEEFHDPVSAPSPESPADPLRR